MTVIGLDFDGVLADFYFKLRYEIGKHYNIQFDFNDIYHQDIRNLFCISEKEYKVLMNSVINTNDHFPIISGALRGFNYLKSRGYNINIITARHTVISAQKWLEENGFGDDISIYSTSKDNIPEVDYFLDDSPRKIANLISYIKQKAFLLSSIYNRNAFDLKNRYIRVSNWDNFIIELEKHIIDRVYI